MDSARPRPLAQLMEGLFAAEIDVGGLLEAVVINRHDRDAFRSRSDSSQELGEICEVHLHAQEGLRFNQPTHADGDTEPYHTEVATHPSAYRIVHACLPCVVGFGSGC